MSGYSAEVLEENNFYPFGLKHEGYNAQAGNPSYNYQYNGKELQRETGWSDYGARMYMSDIGRWAVIDPLSEQYRRLTPYNYVGNNPINFIDPDGRKMMAPTGSPDSVPPPMVQGGMMDYYAHGGKGSTSDILKFLGQEDMLGNYYALYNSGGGGSSTFGLTANTPGSISLLQNYFNVNGVTSSSIDFLYENYDSKKGIMTWWYNGEAASGNSIQGLTGYQIRLSGNDWYGPGGRANWFFGAGAVLSGVKGGLNAERMYGEGIRRGISANYQLTGRNLSQFGKMAATEASMPISSVAKWGGIAGKASFGFGVAMDGIGVYNYYYNPNSKNKVHPAKAGLNTAIGAYGLTGAGTIPALLYFGVDAFYPGGWEGYGNDYQSIQSENSAIIPGFITAPYGSQKF